MRYLDGAPARWAGGPVLEAGVGIMRQACAEEHQRYLLFSSLMRHVAAPGARAVSGRAGGRAVGRQMSSLEKALDQGCFWVGLCH